MTNTRAVDSTCTESSGAPTWWLVFVSEFHQLWMSGKAPILLLIYSVLLGGMTWVMASNSELSIIRPQEMVFETAKAAIAVGLFMSLIIGADSISGERERATLEGLLLTPTSRRQLIFGKFLAGISPWPLAMLISIPYMQVLSQGDEAFVTAAIWGPLLGTVLSPAFTAMGMLTSFWANANKTSLFTSLGIYIVFLLPSQLPGRATVGEMGNLLNHVNPIQSTFVFLSRIIVNNRSVMERWHYLIAPVAFAILIYVVLFWVASPNLRLEGGGGGERFSLWRRHRALAAAASLALVALIMSPALALAQATSPERAFTVPQEHVQISIDADYRLIKTGDKVEYNTVITNNGTADSRSICVAMNIINLNAAGDIVDPEDWSPQRTQYVDTIKPGQSVTMSWTVNAILDGNFLVYMVVVPEPDGREATSQPIASSGIHLSVAPYTKLNPRGVLPYAIGGPVLLLGGMVFLYRRRRRAIDVGDESEE